MHSLRWRARVSYTCACAFGGSLLWFRIEYACHIIAPPYSTRPNLQRTSAACARGEHPGPASQAHPEHVLMQPPGRHHVEACSYGSCLVLLHDRLKLQKATPQTRLLKLGSDWTFSAPEAFRRPKLQLHSSMRFASMYATCSCTWFATVLRSRRDIPDIHLGTPER